MISDIYGKGYAACFAKVVETIIYQLVGCRSAKHRYALAL